MKKTMQKPIGIFLSLLMLLSCCGGITASASGVGTETDPYHVSTADDLRTAAAAGGCIVLDDDIDLGGNSLVINKAVVLDLAGHTLTCANDSNAICVNAAGDITLNDSSGDNSGTVTNTGWYVVEGEQAGCKITINGGTYQNQNLDQRYSAVTMSKNGTVTVNGGVLSGINAALRMRNGTAYVNGGTFISEQFSLDLDYAVGAFVTNCYCTRGISCPNNDNWSFSGGYFYYIRDGILKEFFGKPWMVVPTTEADGVDTEAYTVKIVEKDPPLPLHYVFNVEGVSRADGVTQVGEVLQPKHLTDMNNRDDFCTFAGWFLDEDYTQPFNEDYTVTGETTIYGYFVDHVKLNDFAFTFETLPVPGSTPADLIVSVAEDANYHLSQPSSYGNPYIVEVASYRRVPQNEALQHGKRYQVITNLEPDEGYMVNYGNYHTYTAYGIPSEIVSGTDVWGYSRKYVSPAVYLIELHNWGEPEWEWGNDGSACAVFSCSECEETLRVAAQVEHVHTDAACEAPEVDVYNAKVEMGARNVYTSVCENPDVEPATGHNYDYANAVFHWDGYACSTATATCLIDETHKIDIPVVVATETDAATCVVSGKTVYTASFTADGETYTDEKTEILPATGNHTTEIQNAKEATATEDGYTGDEVCTVCGQTIKQGEVIPATGDNTPDEPDDGDACPYCGKHHAKKWVLIVHLVLWFLCKAFRIVRK